MLHYNETSCSVWLKFSFQSLNDQTDNNMTDNNKEVSPFCQNLLRIFYFAHLLLALAFSVYLLLKYNNIISPTITFAMIVIYGFMAVWVLLISFILIACKRQERAVCLSRILVKFVIFAFPAFGLLSISKDKQLQHYQILGFILYMGVICLLLVVYEILSCCCLGKKYPEFLFQPNDLKQANTQIQTKRKEYNEMISKI